VNNLKSILILVITSSLLTSCMAWIEFDIKRYVFSFIISLVIGVIGLIIMAINGGSKNNKK